MSLKLSLLGEFNLSRDGQSVVLRNKKAQALLVYLALTGRPHSREHLATLLWGERFEEQARSSLRQALHALRKSVGPDVIVGEEELALASDRLTIEADDNGIGADGFMELLPNFRTGEEGFDDWLANLREQCTTEALVKLLTSAETAAAGGDMDTALKLAQRCLDRDPLNEDALCLAMRLLGDSNRRSDALALYARFNKHLNAELNVSPRQDTQALARRLREDVGENHVARVVRYSRSQSAGEYAHALITPFEDLGGGDGAAFFAAELPSELALRARVAGFVTINMATTGRSGRSNDAEYLREAQEHGAQTIVYGSARQIGSQVRVTANILSVVDNRIVWNGRKIVEQTEAFDAISQFAALVTYELGRAVAGQRLDDADTADMEDVLNDPERFQTILQNHIWRTFFLRKNRQTMDEETRFIDLALEKYPQSVDVITWKAFLVFHAAHLGDGKDRVARYRDAKRWVERALAIDPAHQLALGGKIIVSSWLGEFDDADRAYQTMIAEEKSNPSTDGVYSTSLVFRGENDEAISKLNAAIEAERGTTLLFYRFALRGLAEFNKCDFEAAANSARSSLDVGQELFLSHLVRIAALERLGKHSEATRAIGEMRIHYHKPTVSEFEWLPFNEEKPKENFLSALREAGLPE